MTREEQIKEAARKFFDDYLDGLKGETLTVQQTFEDGAKWADEHPNSNGKELLYVAQNTAERTKKELINKACEWLQLNADKYMRAIGGCMYFDVINSVNDFKRAMNEEYSIETIKLDECNPKKQPCVLTNKGIDTNVIKFD